MAYANVEDIAYTQIGLKSSDRQNRRLFLLVNGRFSGIPAATSDLIGNQWFPPTLAAGHWLPRKGAREDASPSKSEAAPPFGAPPPTGLLGSAPNKVLRGVPPGWVGERRLGFGVFHTRGWGLLAPGWGYLR